MRKLASLVLSSILAGALAGSLAGCASTEVEDTESGGGAVSGIDNTSVKEQYVGTCWLYTTAAWAEALHLAAGGEKMDLSESYWTYWTFFERIVAGEVDENGWVEETGTWGFAAELIARYGMMTEADFIPEEADSPTSNRTSDAFNAILTSLSVGKLATRQSRKDRALVRAELDVAFGLRPEAVGFLDQTFGKDGKKTLLATRGAVPSGVPIVRASDFEVAGKRGGPKRTLEEYIGRDLPQTDPNFRTGPHAWKKVAYPAPTSGSVNKRNVLRRIQKSLNDGLPVVVGWKVDHKAVGADGALRKLTGARLKAESHLSLITDYQASNVPGFGVLPVGTPEARPEALAASLENDVVVDLLRIKNSWGAKARQDSAIPAGFHDIYREYFDGGFEACTADDVCKPTQALAYVILPAGY